MSISPDSDQLKAIMHGLGPAMVIAGPGSGKTAVITGRAASLINCGLAAPDSILVITFTHTAAAEMHQRFLRLSAGERREGPVMTGNTPVFGTFHSVFYSLLRHHTGFGSYTLATHAQSAEVLRRLFDRLYPDNRYSSDLYSNLLNSISRFKNGIRDQDPSSSFMGQEPFGLIREYDKMMREIGLFDFDDMLLEFYAALKKDRMFLQAVRSRFRFIMIDEFQDINALQFEIIRMMAQEYRNLFVVGDDDQSIYAFRGSRPEIMLGFTGYYPDAVLYTCVSNYRSQAEIIFASRRLIERNRHRFGKALKAVNPPGAKVTVRTFSDSRREAVYVAGCIADHLQRNPLWSFGILFRNHRLQSEVRRELVKRGLWEETEKGRIRLLTFHASKGLEFDVVFLIGANDETVPGIRHSVTEDEEAVIEEERRLFYVAMTRAKKILHISNTKYIYNKKQTISRYVLEALSMRDRLRYFAWEMLNSNE